MTPCSSMVAPVGAWIAVTGTLEGSLPAVVLGLAVGLWIGGFDLIYAAELCTSLSDRACRQLTRDLFRRLAPGCAQQCDEPGLAAAGAQTLESF